MNHHNIVQQLLVNVMVVLSTHEILVVNPALMFEDDSSLVMQEIIVQPLPVIVMVFLSLHEISVLRHLLHQDHVH